MIVSGYVSSFDGTNIWFRARGESRRYPPLVLFNGIGTTIRYWKYVEEYISNITQVVVFDYRGHGRSFLPKSPDLSMKANALDGKAVMDELRIEKAILGGFSMGVQVILEFFRLFPERVAGLIPALGPFEHPANTFLNLPLMSVILERTSSFVFRFPDISQKIWSSVMNLSFGFRLGKAIGILSPNFFFLNPLLANAEDFVEYFENLKKMDILVFFRMALESQKHSARDVLEKINVPTLIIAGENDIFTPLHVMLEMRRRIKNSEILILRKGSHGGLVEYPELVCLRIEKFIKDKF